MLYLLVFYIYYLAEDVALYGISHWLPIDGRHSLSVQTEMINLVEIVDPTPLLEHYQFDKLNSFSQLHLEKKGHMLIYFKQDKFNFLSYLF